MWSAAVLVGLDRGLLALRAASSAWECRKLQPRSICAAARDTYFKRTARHVPIITDGGMSKGGDVCKALACGADAVMVGSAFAKAEEAPGRGYHWGMATPHANLPRAPASKSAPLAP